MNRDQFSLPTHNPQSFVSANGDGVDGEGGKDELSYKVVGNVTIFQCCAVTSCLFLLALVIAATVIASQNRNAVNALSQPFATVDNNGEFVDAIGYDDYDNDDRHHRNTMKNFDKTINNMDSTQSWKHLSSLSNKLKSMAQFKDTLSELEMRIRTLSGSANHNLDEMDEELSSKLSKITAEIESITNTMVNMEIETDSKITDSNHILTNLSKTINTVKDHVLDIEQHTLSYASK